MVGIEENSSSGLSGLSLPKGVLSGLRGITSPDAPIVYTMPTPTASELAEPALAYTGAPATTVARLTLVADNGEAVITEDDAKDLVDAVTQICMAAGVPPSEMATLVARAESCVGGNKSTLESIRTALVGDAKSFASTAGTKASETPEQNRERQLERIQELSDSIKNDMEKIDDLMTPEEREKLRKAQEREQEEKDKIDALRAIGASPSEIRAAQNAWANAALSTADVSADISNDVLRRNPHHPGAISAAANSAAAAKNMEESSVFSESKLHGDGKSIDRSSPTLGSNNTTVNHVTSPNSEAASTSTIGATTVAVNSRGGDSFDDFALPTNPVLIASVVDGPPAHGLNQLAKGADSTAFRTL